MAGEELGLLEQFAKLVGEKQGTLRVNLNGEIQTVASKVEGVKLSFSEKLLLAEKALRNEIDLVASALPNGGNTAIEFNADDAIRIIGQYFNEDEWTRIVGMVLDGNELSGAGSATTRRYFQEFGQANWRKVQISTVESMVDIAAFDITANSFKTTIAHVRGDIVIIDGVDTFIDSVSDDGAGVYTCVFATLDTVPSMIMSIARSTMQLSDDSGREAGTIEVEIDGVMTTMPADVYTDPLKLEGIELTSGLSGQLTIKVVSSVSNSWGPAYGYIRFLRKDGTIYIPTESEATLVESADLYNSGYDNHPFGAEYRLTANHKTFSETWSFAFTEDIVGMAMKVNWGDRGGDATVLIDGVEVASFPYNGNSIDDFKYISHFGAIKKTYEAQIVDTETLRFKYETTSVNDLVELNADLYTEVTA